MFIFLDTETTGTGPEDRFCQIAFKPEGGQAVCELFNPGKPISIDAMAIHHITEKMVREDPVQEMIHISSNPVLIARMPYGKHTRMWSIGQMIDRNPNECDFTRKFSSLPGAVALDLDDRYRGWQMGLTATIAIVPAECFELVYGLIVY